jgi:hypothetical protein
VAKAAVTAAAAEGDVEAADAAAAAADDGVVVSGALHRELADVLHFCSTSLIPSLVAQNAAVDSNNNDSSNGNGDGDGDGDGDSDGDDDGDGDSDGDDDVDVVFADVAAARGVGGANALVTLIHVLSTLSTQISR